MSYSSFLSLTLCTFILFHACTAQLEQITQSQPFQQTPQQRLRQQRYQINDCRIDRINAQEPARRVQSEAGVTDIWDENDEQFECAGVVVMRHTIQQKGLLLPAYSNGPKLFYVVQGRGTHGVAIPGCPETYQSFEGSRMQSHQSQEQMQGQRDQHQKLRQLREGDVFAVPAGVADWIYNNGQSDLVVVGIIDIGNPHNQLDENHRKFFLAGNPQQHLQSQRLQRYEQGRSRRSVSRRESQQTNGNIFAGFDENIVAESLNVNPDLARRLQNRNDYRGIIVRVEQQLGMISPEFTREGQEEEREQEMRRGGSYAANGVEETFCTARLKFNVNNPEHADVFNPQAGRIATVNSQNLPVLGLLQLTAQKGVLYSNAMMAPHWNMNAHCVCYITRGSGRIQIVDDNGQTVFDGQVQEGQVITAPQNFAVVKRADNEGLEWIAFKTNDNAQIQPLAGRTSALRSMPEDVISNAYQISREEARRIKQNREEVILLSPGSQSRRV